MKLIHHFHLPHNSLSRSGGWKRRAIRKHRRNHYGDSSNRHTMYGNTPAVLILSYPHHDCAGLMARPRKRRRKRHCNVGLTDLFRSHFSFSKKQICCVHGRMKQSFRSGCRMGINTMEPDDSRTCSQLNSYNLASQEDALFAPSANR